jgi:hypothetical protein
MVLAVVSLILAVLVGRTCAGGKAVPTVAVRAHAKRAPACPASTRSATS